MNRGRITADMIEHAYQWVCMMQRWNARGHVCERCGEPNLGPMLVNDLWKTIARYNWEVLCGPCMEARLGRKVQVWDMNGSEWNIQRYAFIHVMYVLFRKDKEHDHDNDAP